jgi:hypothetical protein
MDGFTTTSPYTGSWASTLGGHDARQGFCPVCGAVAPCYRARRSLAIGPRSTGCAVTRPSAS